MSSSTQLNCHVLHNSILLPCLQSGCNLFGVASGTVCCITGDNSYTIRLHVGLAVSGMYIIMIIVS